MYDDAGVLRYLEGLIMDVSEQKFQKMALREENRELRTSVINLYGLGSIVGKSKPCDVCTARFSRPQKLIPMLSFTAKQAVAKIWPPKAFTNTVAARAAMCR